MVNVAVNGVGTIGKRVAEAVKKQEDMNLFCIADVSPSSQLRTVLSEDGALHGTPLYGTNEEGVQTLKENGMIVEGVLEDVLDEIDVVVDATPPGADKANKNNIYEPNGVKAIFQGGADNDIAEVKFNADANYSQAKNEDFVKVVSCNTTSLSRTLSAIDQKFDIGKITANLVRRGGDIPQDSRGPIDSTIPVTKVPSHHGPDVMEVLPHLDVTTLAVKVPVTWGHVHMVTIDLHEDIERKEVIDAFEQQPRVKLLEADKGFDSTGKVHELARDLERPRSDLVEAGVWKETISVDSDSNKLYWMHMVHQESIVVPDNVDAIRAMMDMEDKEVSIEKTNNAMGIE